MRIERMPIPGALGYEIDSSGDVWCSRNKAGKLTPHWHKLTPWLSNTGYKLVCIRPDHGRPYRALVHRLVATIFIPNPNGFPQVNHLDLDKLNNDVDNLEWVTASANKRHAVQFGAVKLGEAHHNAKLTNKQVEEIRDRANAGPLNKTHLANEYGGDPPEHQSHPSGPLLEVTHFQGASMRENIKILVSAIVTMVGVAAAIGAAGIAAHIFCRLFMYGWGIA